MRTLVFMLSCFCVSQSFAEQSSSIAQLAKHGIEPSAESIGAYLHSLAQSGDGRAEFAKWIRLLGDDSFRQREEAMQRLLQVQVVHLDLLETAIASNDPEVQFRAKLILAQFRRRPPDERREDLLKTVFEVMAERRVKKLAVPLLAVIPMCIESVTQRRALEALKMTAEQEDLKVLRAALAAESPTLRIAALAALEELLGEEVVDEAANLLDDPRDSVGLAAALSLANFGDRRSLPVLGRLLNSESSMTRARAVHILRQLSGERFGYRAHDDEEERATRAGQWVAWINENGRSVELNYPVNGFAVDARGLVLHFSFSNSEKPVFDDSKCDNHGTLHNASYTEKGHVGGGCHLDGRGDFIRVANSDELEITEQLTLAIRLKLDSFAPGGYGNEEGHIIKKGDPLWWNPSYGLGYRKGSGRAKFVIGHPVKPANRGGADLYSESRLEVGRWHHLVGTYDGMTAKLYIDGKLDVEKQYKGKIRSDRAPVMIGGGKLFSKNEFANHFAISGTIDDVRIYNRALTADEVVWLFLD